jgi:hypothetical protein
VLVLTAPGTPREPEAPAERQAVVVSGPPGVGKPTLGVPRPLLRRTPTTPSVWLSRRQETRNHAFVLFSLGFPLYDVRAIGG